MMISLVLISQTTALLSFGWVFGFQLDLLEKYLITLAVLTFTWWSHIAILPKKGSLILLKLGTLQAFVKFSFSYLQKS